MNFKEGQRFETSPIVKGDLENGSVVQTASGSRYFLSGKTVQQMKDQAARAAPVPKELKNAPPRATIQLTKKARQQEAEKALKSASPGVTISLGSFFGFGDDEPKDKAPQKKSPPPKPVAKKPAKKVAPRPAKVTAKTPPATKTFGSMFNAGIATPGAKKEVASKPPAPAKKKVAPRGVPTIERWKAGRDKSITGFIRGSNQFQDGEKVTTSPIAKGNLKSGEVDMTSSGSLSL